VFKSILTGSWLLTLWLVGYTSTANLTGIVYRADMFPGLGFLLKRTVFEQSMKNKMPDCCSARSVRRRYRPAVNTVRIWRRFRTGSKRVFIAPRNAARRISFTILCPSVRYTPVLGQNEWTLWWCRIHWRVTHCT